MKLASKFFGGVALAILGGSLAGCPRDGAGTEAVSASEAELSINEASASAEASDLTANTIEITTNFTIGQAVEAAAQALRDFYVSQLPCATVTLTLNSLEVQYGTKGVCLYNGHVITGRHMVTIEKNAQAQVLVHHLWTDLSNGAVKVNGSADVTWTFSDPSRHVIHDLTWTRILDGRTGHGTGDRMQRPLAGGIAVGFQEDGTRTWDGPSGHYELAISGVQMRWADPVPQAGTYTLVIPHNKSLSLAFSRVDDNTIAVTATSGRVKFTFNVHRTGQVSGS